MHEISFEESCVGGTASITVPYVDTCSNCNGSGAKPGTSPQVICYTDLTVTSTKRVNRSVQHAVDQGIRPL